MAMSAAAEGPAQKKRKFADVEQDNLPEWLAAQLEGVCTEHQRTAVRQWFASYGKQGVATMQVQVLDLDVGKIFPNMPESDRVRIVSALHNATRPAPPEPAPWHQRKPFVDVGIQSIFCFNRMLPPKASPIGLVDYLTYWV